MGQIGVTPTSHSRTARLPPTGRPALPAARPLLPPPRRGSVPSAPLPPTPPPFYFYLYLPWHFLTFFFFFFSAQAEFTRKAAICLSKSPDLRGFNNFPTCSGGFCRRRGGWSRGRRGGGGEARGEGGYPPKNPNPSRENSCERCGSAPRLWVVSACVYFETKARL